MRISDWSSDVCSSDLLASGFRVRTVKVASVTKQDEPAKPVSSQRVNPAALGEFRSGVVFVVDASSSMQPYIDRTRQAMSEVFDRIEAAKLNDKVRFGMVAYRDDPAEVKRSEEHTSELQSLMRISYAVFCLKKKTIQPQ